MSERRGGFRLNPIAIILDSLDKRAQRRTATGLRGVFVSHDGLIDDWHEVGASGEPAFQNSWVNFDSNSASAAFRKDGEGTVHIKGLVKGGTLSNAVFTLPVGYRPLKIAHTPVISSDTAAPARMQVNPDGTVVPQTGGLTFYGLRILFPAEQ